MLPNFAQQNIVLLEVYGKGKKNEEKAQTVMDVGAFV